MWDIRESTGNNTWQVKEVMKVYTHRLRGPDIQLIPVVVGGMKDQTV
jgi:hypothetical protein